MTISQPKLDEILALVRQKYPGWTGFADPQFEKDEVTYKQATIAKAKTLLSQEELERLIAESQFDEFIKRLEQIGRNNNLLYQSVPLSGDLSVLYQPNLDKPAFCRAMLDLLYGEGPAHVRLTRYADFVKANNLPNKWTFPTYFLFICHPDTEMFVKPRTTKWFLEFVGGPPTFTSFPTPSAYVTIKQCAQLLKDGLQQFSPRDMVDIQSLIWVCASMVRGSAGGLLTDERRTEFRDLFGEFLREYPASPDGKEHLTLYSSGRAEARRNYDTIVAAADRGEDITEQILAKFLPHADTAANRERGAWRFVAPAMAKDIKAMFEASGFTKPDDWPIVAKAILKLVRRCMTDARELNDACREFAQLGYTKGFQTGMITPILNALRPDDFLLINNKSREVINHFAGTSYSQALADYPAINETGRELIDELAQELKLPDAPSLLSGDLFDMFCHWLVAIKNYGFESVRYWKIAPGENAWQWQECYEKGFIGIGWGELGDLTGISHDEFRRRRDELIKKHDWTKSALNQVWKFVQIKPGDRIVANDGTSRVLGIGRVTGAYYFEAGAKLGHRLPVEWYDVTPRTVNEDGWRRTLIEIDRSKFEAISNIPGATGGDSVRGHSGMVRETGRQSPRFFTEQTFSLLDALHVNPTQQFYTEHKDEFHRHVEEPLQRLFHEVRDRLPQQIRDAMETEKHIFARIPKNDYGRGGAWDFYWGAFYTKGGKRTSDAQLFIGIHSSFLHCGFYIGERESQCRERFDANLEKYRDELVALLEDKLTGLGFHFGDPEDVDPPLDHQVTSFAEWAGSDLDYSVSKHFPKETAIAIPADELIQQVTETFTAVFPLVLLTMSDDPMPAILAYLNQPVPAPVPGSVNPEYPLAQCAEDTGMSETELRRWVRAIERKGQAILYGPPGTGKTFVAEKLARHLIGGGNGFSELVQFHPSYAYEDFMQGIRPQRVTGGLDYPTVRGRFLEFCDRAARCTGSCVLIIDEINRANLARVFGELMYLLEYRQQEIPLAGGGRFRIPGNVRLLGTMNTADRSIALVDYALRRRFAFLPLYPNFDVLRRYHQTTGVVVDGLIRVLQRVNQAIDDPHYHVGISFFLRENLPAELADIWQMEIEPYLEEYFFDQRAKYEQFRWQNIQGEIGW